MKMHQKIRALAFPAKYAGAVAGMVVLGFGLAGCAHPYTSPTASADPASGSTGPGTGVLNVADAAIAGNDPAMALQVSQSVLASDPHNVAGATA